MDRSERLRYFRKLAAPAWDESKEEMGRALRKSSDRRDDGRRRQFSVNIANREQLDRLSEMLEMPRSKVINLALDELAKELDAREEEYVELFAEYTERIYEWFVEEKGCPEEKALELAAGFALNYLPSRKEWIEILERDEPICIGSVSISGAALIAGEKPKGPTYLSRREYLERLFERVLRMITSERERALRYRYMTKQQKEGRDIFFLERLKGLRKRFWPGRKH